MKRKLAILSASALVTLGMVPFATVAYATSNTGQVVTVNGTGSGQAWSGNIESLKNLSSGSISVRFKTGQTKGVGVLFSASDRTVGSRNLTLALNQGHLYWEIRDNQGDTNYKAKLDAEDAFVADNQLHTATVTVDHQGTSIYLDGVQVYSTTSTAFFQALSKITDARIGANIDNKGAEWQFNGSIEEVKVTKEVFSPEQVQKNSPLPAPVIMTTAEKKMLNPEAKKALNAGSVTLQTTVSKDAGKNATLATLLRDETAVAILSYKNDGLVFAMGGQNISLPGTWSAKERVITVTIASDKVNIYADGTYVGSGTLSSHGLATVTQIDSLQNTKVFASSLPHAMIERLSNYSRPSEHALFDSGYANSAAYRIPSLLFTKEGTLIAGADQRVPNAYDSPNDINFVLRRSKDKGKTWSNLSKIIDLPGHGKAAASTIDSVLLQNPTTNTITAVVDVFPGGIGQPNNADGVGQNADGTLKLFSCDRKEYRLEKDGKVTTAKGEKTNWTASSNGDMFNNGQKVGNYYSPLRGNGCSSNTLHLLDTSYVIVTQSHDDGVTWSDPHYINNQVKEPWMKFLGTGPGTGIVIDSGKHKGRLVVPVYYSNSRNVYSSAVIYSDDDGKTWHRGDSPNDHRTVNGHIPGSKGLTQRNQSLHEATVVQSGKDELTLFMRNLNPGSRIGVSRSQDGGATWSAPVFDPVVPDAFSQPNAFSTGTDHKTIVFANANGRIPYRGRGVIRISHDGGRTWAKARTFNPGHYVYQAMAPMPDGSIALLWEREWQGLYFSTIPVNWLNDSPVSSIK